MTAFPIFKRLSTVDYGLYPGTKRSPDLDVAFNSGLTLILGANGLGKTTLVTLLYRMCTGPYELPAVASGAALGGKRLRVNKLSARRRRLFAERVNDGAASASASLIFNLGQSQIEVTRSLENLDLLGLCFDGEPAEPDEDAYQRQILRHAGVSSFADWILLLRHLTFYFEDRRTLVWDPSAQRQLLRLLFLSPASSAKWVETERDVLRRDSAMRNLRNVVSSQERTLTDSEQAVSSAADLRSELGALERLQGIDQEKLDELNGQVAEIEAAHQEAVLAALKAENQNESAFRDLERRQLTAIAAAFPSSGDTARYLMAQLISEKTCLACGAEAPQAAADLQQRLATQRCIVCDTPVARASTRAGDPKAIAKASRELERAEKRLQSARERLAAAEEELERQIVAIQELSTAVAKRAAQIESLARRLPPDEAELHEQRSEVAALRARLETMKRELENRRSQFMRLIKRTSHEIVGHKDEIRESFEEYAEGFLLEDCKLIWSPHKDQIGESGRAIDFPAFELEMGGADFDSPVRREGPEQVSESQREFIDLAFRMSLIRVAAVGGVGSIVIDAPESSLDAVFVKRAARVMARYAKEAENRLIVTSNLIEGNLIPELMRRSGIRKASSDRIVDLLKIAAPTAATRELATQYAAVRDDILKRAAKAK